MKKFLEKIDKKAAVAYMVVIVFALLFIWGGNKITTTGNEFYAGAERAETYYKAKVVGVGESWEVNDSYGGMAVDYRMQSISVLLLEGAMQGEVVEIEYKLNDTADYKVYPYELGGKILVSFNFTPQGEVEWYIADHMRQDSMLAGVVVFALLIMAFGRLKGVRTIISLGCNFGAVFLVLLPGIIKGYNIYLLTLVISAFMILTTLAMISGFSAKTFASAVGCISGVSVAALLAVIMQSAMKITGLLDEDSAFVMYINAKNPLDLRGIIFAATVIGAVGAIMDVSVSMAASLEEIIQLNPNVSGEALLRSGMNIGRDVIATMANTLLLAYVGSSLHVILLLMAYSYSMGNIINRERVVVEVLQALAGSIGILVAIPATAFVTVLMRKYFVAKPVEQIQKDD